MNKPTCTVMVGLPALGKSYHINNILHGYGAVDRPWIYSTDMYIDAVAEDNGITYSEAFASNIKAATEFNEQKLETMMKLGKDIIWDQTNLGVGKRRKIINRMKAAGYIVNCICLLPPEAGWLSDQNSWKHRLNSREGKIIPQHVLSNMMESFVIPTRDEGFDNIKYYNMWGASLIDEDVFADN